MDAWRDKHKERNKKERCVMMANSKMVRANEKIAGKIVGTFGKIEKSVVGGYTKIEDAFVDRYLAKDGETIEEAKKRLRKDRNYKGHYAVNLVYRLRHPARTATLKISDRDNPQLT